MTGTCLTYIINAIVADDMVTRGFKALAALILYSFCVGLKVWIFTELSFRLPCTSSEKAFLKHKGGNTKLNLLNEYRIAQNIFDKRLRTTERACNNEKNNKYNFFLHRTKNDF